MVDDAGIMRNTFKIPDFMRDDGPGGHACDESFGIWGTLKPREYRREILFAGQERPKNHAHFSGSREILSPSRSGGNVHKLPLKAGCLEGQGRGTNIIVDGIHTGRRDQQVAGSVIRLAQGMADQLAERAHRACRRCVEGAFPFDAFFFTQGKSHIKIDGPT